MKLSVTIMAHPKRKKYVKELKKSLGRVHVEWDKGISLWDTARRSWLSHKKRATHHLVIQDDALPSKDLLNVLQQVIEAKPNEVINLCTVEYKLSIKEKENYQQIYDNDERWFTNQTSLSAVALIIPTKYITEMIDYCDGLTTPHDDKRILMWLRHKRKMVWNTVPSLVEHRPANENPSLVENDKSNRGNRQAFIYTKDATKLKWK